MKCGNCGNMLEPNATFCNKCGTPVATSEPAKKGGSKIIIFIILLLVFLGIGIGIGFVIGKGQCKETKCKSDATELKKSSENEEKEEDKKEEPKEEEKKDDKQTETKESIKKVLDPSKIQFKAENDMAKNIEVLNAFYDEKYHELYVLAKNNNSESIDYTFYLNYLDSSGTRIDRNIGNGYADSGKQFVVMISNYVYEDFSTVNVTMKADKYRSYYHSVNLEKKDLDISQTDSGIKVAYKNNTKNTFSAYISIIYYKDGKVVFVDKGTLISVKPGYSADTSFSIYKLPGYEYSKHDPSFYYDKYDVIVSAANYYDSDY
ncbi:MAG: zinc ribbon domain-containing protein [Bacilli bacterium]|nr:zinc ribbon domain-containing protein [Bacilli bacterium]